MDLHTEDREVMETLALNIKLHSRDGISGTVYCWKYLCGWGFLFLKGPFSGTSAKLFILLVP